MYQSPNDEATAGNAHITLGKQNKARRTARREGPTVPWRRGPQGIVGQSSPREEPAEKMGRRCPGQAGGHPRSWLWAVCSGLSTPGSLNKDQSQKQGHKRFPSGLEQSSGDVSPARVSSQGRAATAGSPAGEPPATAEDWATGKQPRADRCQGQQRTSEQSL